MQENIPHEKARSLNHPLARLGPPALIAALFSIMAHVGAAVILSVSPGEQAFEPSFDQPDPSPAHIIQVHLIRPAPVSLPRVAQPTPVDGIAKPFAPPTPARQGDGADDSSPLIDVSSSTEGSTHSSGPASTPRLEGPAGFRGRCLWRGSLSETERAVCLGQEQRQGSVTATRASAPDRMAHELAPSPAPR